MLQHGLAGRVAQLTRSPRQHRGLHYTSTLGLASSSSRTITTTTYSARRAATRMSSRLTAASSFTAPHCPCQPARSELSPTHTDKRTSLSYTNAPRRTNLTRRTTTAFFARRVHLARGQRSTLCWHRPKAAVLL